jgi:hypothetical protein
MGLCAIALAAFGMAGSVLFSLVALVIAGFATDFYEVTGLTYFQNSIPDPVYARFYSVFLLALSAGALIGALAGPGLDRILGPGNVARRPRRTQSRTCPRPGRHVTKQTRGWTWSGLLKRRAVGDRLNL